jgi:hypothetical protein
MQYVKDSLNAEKIHLCLLCHLANMGAECLNFLVQTANVHGSVRHLVADLPGPLAAHVVVQCVLAYFRFFF